MLNIVSPSNTGIRMAPSPPSSRYKSSCMFSIINKCCLSNLLKTRDNKIQIALYCKDKKIGKQFYWAWSEFLKLAQFEFKGFFANLQQWKRAKSHSSESTTKADYSAIKRLNLSIGIFHEERAFTCKFFSALLASICFCLSLFVKGWFLFSIFPLDKSYLIGWNSICADNLRGWSFGSHSFTLY